MIAKKKQNFGKRMKKMQEMFNKDQEQLKKKQMVRNNKITEIKNTLERITSKITEAKEQIGELEDRIEEITAKEQNKEKRMKRIDESLKDIWVNIHTNIRIIEVPEKEKVYQKTRRNDFPSGTCGKESACQCRRCKRYSFNPWVEKIPWKRAW